MSFFNYLENAVLDHIVGKTTYALPTCYIGLHAGPGVPAEDGTGISEPAGGSYARVATAGADWNAASAGATANANAITFAQATADWSAGADLTYLVAFDALSAGNPLFYGALTVAKPVLNGDTASFPAGDIDITLD